MACVTSTFTVSMSSVTGVAVRVGAKKGIPNQGRGAVASPEVAVGAPGVGDNVDVGVGGSGGCVGDDRIVGVKEDGIVGEAVSVTVGVSGVEDGCAVGRMSSVAVGGMGGSVGGGG